MNKAAQELNSQTWAIECEAVVVQRGRASERRAAPLTLNRVSLQVPPGAVVGLVGTNGAGKSTLIECLTGLIIPKSGHCRLFGQPSADLDDTVKQRLGYAAQHPDLFDWMTVDGHFKRFGHVYPDWSDPFAAELSDRLGLNPREHLFTSAQALSGGDRQKLNVVLAMAHDPDLLILDEPVAHLDPLARRQFTRSLFKRRSPDQDPRTVLISSHLLSDLERMVSHVAFMRQGRLQLFGAWDELTENLRLLELPMGHSALPHAPLVHRRRQGEQERVVFDQRTGTAPAGAGRALTLDELFIELNEGDLS